MRLTILISSWFFWSFYTERKKRVAVVDGCPEIADMRERTRNQLFV